MTLNWHDPAEHRAFRATGEYRDAFWRYVTVNSLGRTAAKAGAFQASSAYEEAFEAWRDARTKHAGAADAGRGEVRITDPETGGEKGQKQARFDLIPADALWAIAEHFGRGAEKYADRNWEKGYDWSLSYGAMMRHVWAWWGGEDVDEETGSSHMVAVAWHALVLVANELRGNGTDDRPDES